MIKNKVKVLIIDDSAVVRQSLRNVLSSDGAIEVIGSAQDPIIAATKMKRAAPDVITLDIEMPRMDGLTFLKKIMQQHPLPVVICSSLTISGSETLAKAIEYGAVDFINKPQLGTKQFIEESKVIICDVIKAAAQVKPVVLKSPIAPKLSADCIIEKSLSRAMVKTSEKFVVVGSSTGGTDALRVFLEALPNDAPGIVIVQHMPEGFTRSFALRLNELCRVTVKEAEDDDSILRGRVLIARGNHHLICKRSGSRYYVVTNDGPLVSRHRPSVDVLFRSAARFGGKNVVGVIMTGMGDDGASGMKELHDVGAHTIAQDEKTSVVFGMPNEAIKKGGVDKILPLEKIYLELKDV